MTQAPNSLWRWCRTPRDAREILRNSVAHLPPDVSAEPKIIPKSVDLMHTLMQDCHDADVAI